MMVNNDLCEEVTCSLSIRYQLQTTDFEEYLGAL